MNIAILLAAGSSSRAGSDKLWADVWGKPLWFTAYEAFGKHPLVEKIILVVRSGEEEKFRKFVDSKTIIVAGGITRMQSFKAGLNASSWTDADILIDHNAASPGVTEREITDSIKTAQTYGAAAVSIPCVDTVIEAYDHFYMKPLNRETLRLMQTPQAVRGDILRRVDLGEATDLVSALLPFTPIRVIEASPQNRKITFKEDIELWSLKTAFGEDSHKFGESGTLTLGGLAVPELPAMQAASDGDVILHALGRALAQIKGKSFSAIADPFVQRGIKDSREFLVPLLDGITLRRVAIHIEALRPKIDSLPIAFSLAKILNIPEDKIHISAQTGEGLTSFGRGEGIYCRALIHYS
jgi:2-C-methyl-D-erythritol 4-phosphate cytidylyltransferase/2-C-methyl-D-erythritol 2,4-cyclodiphosphate synthase